MMKSSRVVLSCLVSIVLVTAVSATWVPLTGKPNSLSSLQGESFIFGDKELSEIDVFGIGAGGAIAPDANSVFVQGGQDSVTGNHGLRFLLSWNAGSGQTVNATFSFRISILPSSNYFIKDVVLDITGVSATGTGIVNVGERVENAGGNIIASLSCSKQYSDSGAYLTDHADFDPLKAIWIHSKDVSITGGTNGAAHLSEFYQYYSQVPEPATIVMLGFGVLNVVRRKNVHS